HAGGRPGRGPRQPRPRAPRRRRGGAGAHGDAPRRPPRAERGRTLTAAPLLRRPLVACVALLASAVTGCAEGPIVAPLRYAAPPPPPEEAFRARPPAPGPAAPAAPVDFRSAVLANGLRVVVIEHHALPIVAMRLVISTEPGALPDREAYALLLHLMNEGTAQRAGPDLSAAWASLGARHARGRNDDGCW